MDPQQTGHPQQGVQYYALPEKPQQQYAYQQPPADQSQQLPPGHAPGPAPAPAAGGPTILSVKRSTALIFLGVLGVFFILVIGLAAGLGVSQRNLSQTQSDLQLAQAAIAAVTAGAAASTSVLVTPTKTAPTSTPTATVKSDVQCPRINGTLYTAGASASNGTTKQFRLLCGFDYGEGEATDIGNVNVKNLNACADACAARANCTGAGWGVIKGDKGPEHTCWLKNNLTTPHNATSAWGFAVLTDPDETAPVAG